MSKCQVYKYNYIITKYTPRQHETQNMNIQTELIKSVLIRLNLQFFYNHQSIDTETYIASSSVCALFS